MQDSVKIPPNSLEAEAAVIGAILKDESGEATDAAAALDLEAFYLPAHRHIMAAIKELYTADKPIEYVTLATELNKQGVLEDIGGVGYISRLASSVPTAANIGEHITILREKHTLRKAIQAAQDQIRMAYETEDASQVVASMDAAAAAIAEESSTQQDFKPIREVCMDVIDTTETKAHNRANGIVGGLPSGFTDLDKMTTGFQKGDLIIIAARPSVGKTAFALNVAQNVALNTGETVAVFSLEMSAPQLVQRMICADANLDANILRTGDLRSDEEWFKLTQGIARLSDTNICIDDTPGIRVSEIRAKCRRLKKEKGLGLIVIDYLQLIQGSGRRGENRQQEVSEISRMLKQIARELDVPVIALSQLSRGVEQRQDKRPMMSDLRESGAIEQDADIVAFLYRDDYYNAETEKKNIIEIIIAKQRNGPVGTVELVFLKNFNKFVNLAHSA